MERRARTGKKRAVFQVPARMPLGVRELWKAATEEERARAHRQATVILAHWLGKRTKTEAAAELEVKPLRVWQLSQMAVSGMVAGLLKQPRKGRGQVVMSPEEDPVVLRKRIRQLEHEVESMERLVQLVRDLPLSQAAGTGGKKMATGSGPRGRKPTPVGGKTSSGRTGNDCGPARSVAPDAVGVEAVGGGGATSGGEAAP